MDGTGRVANMLEPGRLRLETYPLPEPGPGAVVAEVARANVCGSELHIWRGHHPTKRRGVLGHEMVLRIAALGDGVTADFAGEPVAPGDRVVAAYFLTCRRCGPCRRGQFHLCENAYRYWSLDPEVAPHFHGSFATHYYLHPDQYFYKVPDDLPDELVAGANCALSQVYFGLDEAGLSAGETLVVQGAGGLGLYAVAVAKERGARVVVLDQAERRLAEARAFGADAVVDLRAAPTAADRAEAVRAVTGGEGADVGLEVAGVPEAFAEGIQLVRPGGRYVEIGNISPGLTVPFDPGLLTRRSIRIIPVVRYQPWYLKKALDFLQRTRERYPYATLLDATFPLDRVEEALDRSARREIVRASIVPA
jgi:threonine dehydrogenase-like Zn-dependent dehydrogenase